MRLPPATHLLAAALLAAAACERPGSERPPAGSTCRPPPARSPGLWIAGSGTNLALTRAIAARWSERGQAPRVVVPESIGTSGALQALAEGAIDVGLASRPLTPAERLAGLHETPLARVAFAPVVGSALPLEDLSSAELAALFDGARPGRWPAGVPVAPVLREPRDSGYLLLGSHFPAVGAALQRARASGRWPVRYTDQEMRDTLLSLDGAVGLLDVATVRLEGRSLKPLSLDGVAPTAENVRAGRYPLVRPLSFVTRGAPSGDAARFLSFALSDEVSDLFAAGELVRGGGASVAEEGR
ncbi:MAG TPA: substrate-binding domain-containing protein [Myxococcales bacterium]|jgi:phosphate transport system substrate-binding protein